ncbi:cysteine desulfurase [Paracrocinitomix mangrovi]|uniref:cysteine desulfurase family protein n=1 Tax=Paracrocinitomix mangrovi TaxID=2862509 RepID=UPI001C8D8174|nr:cysteine desulfurase family protein [Paracrocinitomix mangrovi]UKN01265.1 cysteine desulfurase [Paracrocinitomix mangrovi]
MKVYLDNAATTPMAPQVIERMTEVMKENFGNPSSIHSFGRNAKAVIEIARREVAKLINAEPKEIIFTSGGTEADNMAITSAVKDLGVTRVISSKIEHHAVGHTIDCLDEEVTVEWVKLSDKGAVDLADLERLLSSNEKTLVSLMHANNEIGTLLDIKKVSEICKKHGAYFHSDTVQTMGHYKIDVKDIGADYITCAAHKFHGPKGVGFLYVNKNIAVSPIIQGGAQERGLRGGTENLIGIAGLAEALKLANEDIQGHIDHVQGLKSYMMDELKNRISDVEFHGETDPDKSLYTVLNVCFPDFENKSMLLFLLDIDGVACSGGSACTSGSNTGSHVLRGINADTNRPNARFSFSRFTTKEEVDYALSIIEKVVVKAAVKS